MRHRNILQVTAAHCRAQVILLKHALAAECDGPVQLGRTVFKDAGIQGVWLVVAENLADNDGVSLDAPLIAKTNSLRLLLPVRWCTISQGGDRKCVSTILCWSAEAIGAFRTG